MNIECCHAGNQKDKKTDWNQVKGAHEVTDMTADVNVNNLKDRVSVKQVPITPDLTTSFCPLILMQL